MSTSQKRTTRISLRIRAGLVITIVGFFIFLLGAEPGLFGMDRSPVVGFVQIAVFLTGLAIICLGGYISLAALWNGIPKSIASDIGLRLVSTGYVIAVAAGMADVFGFGSEKPPATPVFGSLQTVGVVIGEVVIAIGFILLIPFNAPQAVENEANDQVPGDCAGEYETPG